MLYEYARGWIPTEVNVPVTCEYRIISIGTLPAHPLRDETSPQRTPHATTTLLSVDDRRILVNPSLPPQLLESRLDERASIKLADITDVFLTSFYPDHRRSLSALAGATWYVSEAEREAMHEFLEGEQSGADSHFDQERQHLIEAERDLVARTTVAPDRLADGIDLFPLPGVSPGCCGLLLPMPQQTVLICGDAVPTIEHLEQGKILPSCWNREQAMESFKEAVEIADVLVPGRDNSMPNPIRSRGLLG